MKRLFFALWPDETIRQNCQKIVHSLHGHGRPVAVTNLHATLVFLGNVNETQQAAMTEAAAQISVPPMTLTFNQLAYWKRPAIVCLVAERVDPIVLTLVEQLTAAALKNGIAVEQRPYRPHITLLRKAKVLPELEIQPIDWLADNFCLVESCSTPTGVAYRVIQQWLCAAPVVDHAVD